MHSYPTKIAVYKFVMNKTSNYLKAKIKLIMCIETTINRDIQTKSIIFYIYSKHYKLL